MNLKTYIVGETIIPITHTLSGTARERRFKPAAAGLFQGGGVDADLTVSWTSISNWQQISVVNTAIAAKKILEDQDRTQAAVCSAYAAKVHGLSVLTGQDINDEPNNSTRFIVVTNQKIYSCRTLPRSAFVLKCLTKADHLYRILSHFIYNDLNMTRIESRPVEGKNWEYRFLRGLRGQYGSACGQKCNQGFKRRGQKSEDSG